jgi:hypothetical protein
LLCRTKLIFIGTGRIYEGIRAGQDGRVT